MVSCGLTVFFLLLSLPPCRRDLWFLVLFAAFVWVEAPRSNHKSHTNNHGHLLYCHGHWVLGAAKRRSTHTPHTTSQAEPHRTEANRTTPSRVEPNRGEPSQAKSEPCHTTPHHTTSRHAKKKVQAEPSQVPWAFAIQAIVLWWLDDFSEW